MPGPLGANVQAPLLVPPAISLFSAAQLVDEADARWHGGLRYVPESCQGGGIFATLFCDPTTTEKTESVVTHGAPVTGTPLGVVSGDTCSTFSKDVAEYQARATRLLLANESRLVAAELWTNSLGLNVPIAGTPGQVNATPGGGAVSVALSVAFIEQAFLDCASGVRPYIHVRPYVLEAMLGLGSMAVRREGNRYYTALDSIIVADAGYPGTGPSGQAVGADSEWIYATGPVQIRRSPLTTLPGTMKEATDRATNDVTFYAERVVSAVFDYSCCTVALNTKRLS